MTRASETVRWNGRTLTLFRDGPRPIYTTPEGRFAVQHGETWKTFASMKGAEKFAATGRATVKLFSTTNSGNTCHSNGIHVVDAAEWTDGGRIIDGDGKKHYARYEDWYEYDAEAIAQLKEWEKRRAAAEKQFNAEFQAITQKLKRVTRERLPALLKARGATGNVATEETPR